MLGVPQQAKQQQMSANDNSEQRLLAQISSGDARGMERLYRCYAPLLTAVCSRYIAGQDDVKDVLQEAFIKIFTSLGSFSWRGEGSLKAWMRRIVVNEALNHIRRAGQLPAVDGEDELLKAADTCPQDEPDISDITPEQLQELIRQLPDGYRTVLNLYVFERRSHKEIALLLGIKPTTSASQFLRAKDLLAKMINQLKHEKEEHV